MLGSIRKFSTSIYAKILLAIVIIPFVFWGMGSSLRGGNKNVVVVIENEKYSIQEFTNFIKLSANNKVEANQIESFLSAFIAEKLIEKEIDKFDIKLSNKTLAQLIKNQKLFNRENKFSRVEYEKFLLESNITAITFETMLLQQEKKKQLLQFIGGGISPSKFLVNIAYDQVNQKRSIDLINLNKAFQNKFKFTDDQIKTYFDNNKDIYSETYKSINLIELNPLNLTGNIEFTDLFFKKIDEIDDLIINGGNLNQITKEFNLPQATLLSINKSGKEKNLKNNPIKSKNLVNIIFNINSNDPTNLIEDKNKYYIVELMDTENIFKKIDDEKTKKQILVDLKKTAMRQLVTEIIDKINKNKFNKSNFNELAKETNSSIEKIKLESQNDEKILKNNIVSEIYSYPEKKVIVVHDIGFEKNYLIYIEKIENVIIDDNLEKFQTYEKFAKTKMIGDLYNTYDNYLKKNYEIDINYQALNTVKNYFN